MQSKLVVGETKEFIHGTALSHEGHTHAANGISVASSTAARFQGISANVDAILSFLGSNNLYANDYWWITRTVNPIYVEKRISGQEAHMAYVAGVPYSATYTLDKITGKATLGPTYTTANLYKNGTSYSIMRSIDGMYIRDTHNYMPGYISECVYYSTAYASVSESEDYVRVSNVTQITSVLTTSYGKWTYVHSSNQSAYPTGISGANEYVPLGRLIDGVHGSCRIRNGSYTGTGNDNSGNAVNYKVLTLDFIPTLIFVWHSGIQYIITGSNIVQASDGTHWMNTSINTPGYDYTWIALG